MKLDFIVDGRAGEFERSSSTGRAVLRIGDESQALDSPWNPSTHFDLSTTKTWKAHLGGHDIVVVKKRARVFGGLREASFTLLVDGAVVTAKRGY
ncbi:MAG: hypothetical protein M3Y42_09285 [Actinomycetota bacterium]|nr:hypothetical protein [Actinomycetota bacterium]MDQ2957145.1 hypothetical protein [Actinomycetota bacterium]